LDISEGLEIKKDEVVLLQIKDIKTLLLCGGGGIKWVIKDFVQGLPLL